VACWEIAHLPHRRFDTKSFAGSADGSAPLLGLSTMTRGCANRQALNRSPLYRIGGPGCAEGQPNARYSPPANRRSFLHFDHAARRPFPTLLGRSWVLPHLPPLVCVTALQLQLPVRFAPERAARSGALLPLLLVIWPAKRPPAVGAIDLFMRAWARLWCFWRCSGDAPVEHPF